MLALLAILSWLPLADEDIDAKDAEMLPHRSIETSLPVIDWFTVKLFCTSKEPERKSIPLIIFNSWEALSIKFKLPLESLLKIKSPKKIELLLTYISLNLLVGLPISNRLSPPGKIEPVTIKLPLIIAEPV